MIFKERRIFELERKLKAKEEEVEKLKEERDRLISISNELRAELNTAQKQLTLYKDSLEDNRGRHTSDAESFRGGNILVTGEHLHRSTADFNKENDSDS